MIISGMVGDAQMKPGLVYFVTYDNDAWRKALPVVKIGSTTDLKRRISQLSTGSPVSLISAGHILCDSGRKAERLEFSIHSEFNWCRLSGEWFKLDVVALNKLKSYDIKKSRFDELFVIRDMDLTMTTLAHARDKLVEMTAEIKEKDRIIETMRRRLIEVDPMAYKYIPKTSCRRK